MFDNDIDPFYKMTQDEMVPGMFEDVKNLFYVFFEDGSINEIPENFFKNSSVQAIEFSKYSYGPDGALVKLGKDAFTGCPLTDISANLLTALDWGSYPSKINSNHLTVKVPVGYSDFPPVRDGDEETEDFRSSISDALGISEKNISFVEVKPY